MASSTRPLTDFRNLPGTLSENGQSFDFNQLRTIGARGREMYWQISVRLTAPGPGDSDAGPGRTFIPIRDEYFSNLPMPSTVHAWTKVSSGFVDGKERKSAPTIITKGKNIGRANATNVFCQALSEARSKYNMQLKKIVETEDDGTSVIRYPPMLAKVLDNDKPPAEQIFIQRKYNGVRAVATLDFVQPADAATAPVVLYSRSRHTFPGFGYIRDELAPMLRFVWEKHQRHLYLDGEIYLHGASLQDISGVARRAGHVDIIESVIASGLAQPLNYMVYDCFDPARPELKFSERLAELQELFGEWDTEFVKLVPTTAGDIDSANDEFKKYIDEGYEGAIIRHDAPYVYSYNNLRSSKLLKLKPTLDEEFRVVGWERATKGKAVGLLMLIFEVEGPDGELRQFTVTPATTEEERRRLADSMDEVDESGETLFEREWLGQMVRVYFDELSDDGVPLRGRTRLERLGREIIK